MMRILVLLFFIAMTMAVPRTAAALEALDRNAKVAFLGLTFLDFSTEGAYYGARTDESARIALLEQEIRDRFIREGFTLLDTTPVAEELSRTHNPANCYGCDLRMAAKLGADYGMVGEVHKVSNLVLTQELVLRDVKTGQILRRQVVDFRSNTDATWLRAIRYILNNHFFKI